MFLDTICSVDKLWKHIFSLIASTHNTSCENATCPWTLGQCNKLKMDWLSSTYLCININMASIQSYKHISPGFTELWKNWNATHHIIFCRGSTQMKLYDPRSPASLHKRISLIWSDIYWHVVLQGYVGGWLGRIYQHTDVLNVRHSPFLIKQHPLAQYPPTSSLSFF